MKQECLAKIRPEEPCDIDSIRQVNRRAFGSNTEVQLVDDLRDDGLAVVSLVAEIDGSVVGHILLSKQPIETDSGMIPAVLLAPLAVVPEHQKKGIGFQLVNRGLKASRELGQRIAIVVGHPDYYPRFGFSAELAKQLENKYAVEAGDAFMVAELTPGAMSGIAGKVVFPLAIDKAMLADGQNSHSDDFRLTTAGKLLSLEELDAELARHRGAGQRIAMTNGCFDLLHPGHVASLEAASNHGDCLVVGLNSDISIRKLKGPGRPIVDERGRAAMLAALQCVDYVVLFDDASVVGLIEHLLPDVLVKSAQYALEEVVGRETVEAAGGRVVLTPMSKGYSTTQLLGRIQAATTAKASASLES